VEAPATDDPPRIDALRDISQSILSASSAEAVAEATLERLATLVPYLRGSVVEFDSASDAISVLAVDDPETPPSERGEELSLAPFREAGTLLQAPRYVEEIPEADLTPIEEHLRSIGARSYLNVPLRSENDDIGVLNVAAPTPAAYTEEHRAIAREAADMLAVAPMPNPEPAWASPSRSDSSTF
jgi:GAF domain-containing protein